MYSSVDGIHSEKNQLTFRHILTEGDVFLTYITQSRTNIRNENNIYAYTQGDK